MEGRATTIVAIFVVCSILLPLALAKHGLKGLRVGFYDDSCPRAEEIVAEVVSEAYKKNPGVAAGFLRLFTHDCFVNGCDASLLLDATPSGEKTEKDSPPNGKFVRGFEVIDEAKARLESECPGIVSCADTLSFATRDGSVLAGVPKYNMPGGRRDGLVSRAEDVDGNLPVFVWPIQQIIELFVKKGLTMEEMVVLTGAHSIGTAHCPTFAYRVNNYNATFQTDPKIDAIDSANIKAACQRQVSQEEIEKTTLPLDTATPFKMDNIFYKHLLEGRGLLESDQAIAIDPKTRRVVEKLADNEDEWFKKFGRAMIRLAAVDVKTGEEGEIRKQCRFVNSKNTGNSGNTEDSGKSGDAEDSGTSGDAEDSGKSGDAEDSGKSGDAEDPSHTVDSSDSSDSADSGDSSDDGSSNHLPSNPSLASAEPHGQNLDRDFEYKWKK